MPAKLSEVVVAFHLIATTFRFFERYHTCENILYHPHANTITNLTFRGCCLPPPKVTFGVVFALEVVFTKPNLIAPTLKVLTFRGGFGRDQNRS